jgi:hypothetical protein
MAKRSWVKPFPLSPLVEKWERRYTTYLHEGSGPVSTVNGDDSAVIINVVVYVHFRGMYSQFQGFILEEPACLAHGGQVNILFLLLPVVREACQSYRLVGRQRPFYEYSTHFCVSAILARGTGLFASGSRPERTAFRRRSLPRRKVTFLGVVTPLNAPGADWAN